MTPRTPDVSVVVAAYNAAPYIGRCVGSVLGQSIGAERLELIVIDDGSTDGTGEELDRLAADAPSMRVVHQPNSGGPAQPRNTGLDRATGRYVFILDSDDHLNPEALKRMVAMADQCGSDVLLGKMEAGGGRPVPRAMFRYNQPNADLYTSHVYWTLNPMKMYRREFLERIGLRFRLDLPYGEDLPFVATAYLNASIISVLADYPCVHWVNRDDGNNITLRDFRLDTNMALARVMFALVGESVEPGPKRDHLFKRHFAYEIDRLLTCLMLEPDRDARAAAMREIAVWIGTYYNETIDRAMQPYTKICLDLIARSMPDELVEVIRFQHDNGDAMASVEGDRVFALYPFFRDAEKGVPDAAYEATTVLRPACRLASLELDGPSLVLCGVASIGWLGPAEVMPILRQRETAEEIVCEPATSSEGGAFCARIDFLGDGTQPGPGLGHWDVWLRLRAEGFEREMRPGSERADDLSTEPKRGIAIQDATHAVLLDVHFTPFNNITVRVSDATHHLAEVLTTHSVAWSDSDRATLMIRGRACVSGLPEDAVSVSVSSEHASYRVPAVLGAEGSYVAQVSLRHAADGHSIPDGKWSLDMRLDVADLHGSTPVRWFEDLPSVRWRRGLGLARAKVTHTEKGSLRLAVTRVKLLGALTRRLKR